MDFGLSEEQVMLKNSAREFLDKECPKAHVRQMLYEDDRGYSPDLWRKMAELGWQGLAIPEQYGGTGMTFLDLAVLLEEMGRALLPAPFMSTVVWCGLTILKHGTEDQKKAYLPKIASGEAIFALALYEPNGGGEAENMQLKAEASGNDFILNGTKLFVRDAHVANNLLVVARTRPGKSAAGINLFIVDAKSRGIKSTLLKTMTGEKQCEVVFKDVKVPKANILGKAGKGWATLNDALVAANAAECMWMVGGARWAMETAVQYAKERVQFDKPIGSFQAIQHQCANMLVDVESATSISTYASWAVSENHPEASLASSAAKAWCSDIYKRTAAAGIQMHGGIGFTWDHDMHLYFKRAKASEALFGDGDYHREKVAQILKI